MPPKTAPTKHRTSADSTSPRQANSPTSSDATATVEAITPAETAPLTPNAPAAGTGQGAGEITPISSYEANTDSAPDSMLEPTRPPAAETVPVTPGQAAAASGTAASGTTVAGAPTKPGDAGPELRADFFDDRTRGRQTPIPGYSRGLVLDDPNIAHSAALRFSFASVELDEAATTWAMFFQGSVAVTRALGFELAVPVEYVNLDVDNTKSVLAFGNPLVTGKYRLFLPKVEGRRPAVIVRARWGIPLSPAHNVPPTSLEAEKFSREVYFADTYAFWLEKTDLGLGAMAAWQISMVQLAFQVYGDYFFPISQAFDRSSFLTLSYGASVGVLPLGDMVGVYAEARSVTLLSGPRRSEFFTYLGARGRFLDGLEPALWVSMPLGSVRKTSGLQIGIELRFSYDIEEVITSSQFTRFDNAMVE